jgi:hypothetical protein
MLKPEKSNKSQLIGLCISLKWTLVTHFTVLDKVDFLDNFANMEDSNINYQVSNGNGVNNCPK